MAVARAPSIPLADEHEHEDEDEDETSTLMKHYDTTTHTDLPFYVIFYILKWIYYTLYQYL